MISDEAEIRLLIMAELNEEVELTKANRGKIMKMITPIFKGKADMKIVSGVVGEMLK